MRNVSGMQLASLTADPASPPDGTLWYRSDTDIVHTQLDGATRVVSSPYLAKSTSTTAIGTTVTAVNNLTLTLPAGTWSFTAWIPITSVGAFTGFSATISPAGAPTITFLKAQVAIWSSAAPPTVIASCMVSAFNTASLPTASGTSGPSLVTLSGAMVSTGAGVLAVSLTRTTGTSATTAIGSFLQATRIGV